MDISKRSGEKEAAFQVEEKLFKDNSYVKI